MICKEAGVDFHSMQARSQVYHRQVPGDGDRGCRAHHEHLLGSQRRPCPHERSIKAALVDSEWFYVEGYLVTDEARTLAPPKLAVEASQGEWCQGCDQLVRPLCGGRLW